MKKALTRILAFSLVLCMAIPCASFAAPAKNYKVVKRCAPVPVPVVVRFNPGLYK